DALLLPYGVVLVSLSGLPALLEMEDILRRAHRRYRATVVIGTLIAIALAASFGFVVWGVTGHNTTSAAIVGLQNVIGGPVGIIGSICGFLAVVTAFFSVGNNLRSTLQYDYNLRPDFSWLLALGVPFSLLLMGTND